MFSVIVPLYNKEVSIQTTLFSILNQTFKRFEVIVVDDDSIDKSYLKVNEIKSLNPNIVIIQKVNGGVSSARNEGIRRAKYDFIAFLDADDTWEPTYLEEQAKLINEFPEAEMWGTAWGYKINDQIIRPEKMIPRDFRGILMNYFQLNLHLYWTSAVVVHKPVFEKVGYFDERISIGEDLDMWCRIILHFPVSFYNKYLAFYNQNAESRLMNIKMPDLKLCLPYYIDKFNSYHYTHPYFIKYIHTFCAGYIQPYYFGNKFERQLSVRVIKQLNYSRISRKYSLLYRTPLFLGFLVYIVILIRRRCNNPALTN